MSKNKRDDRSESFPVYPESVLVAFHRLIQAALNGTDVILLSIDDKSASQGIQEYNDAHFEIDEDRNAEDPADEQYRLFVDRLAEKFDKHRTQTQLKPVKMPGRQEKEVAEKLLNMLLRRS